MAELAEVLKTREAVSWTRLHPMLLFRSLPAVVDGVCAAPGVKCFKVFERVLQDADAGEIARLLETNTSLRRFEFASCEMSEASVAIISEALARNTTLEAIAFGASSSEEAGMLAVFRSAVRHHASIRSISFSDFDGISGEHVTGVLAACPALTSLSFDNCALGDDLVGRICSSLAGCTSLRALRLEAARIGDEGVLAIAKLLAANGPLEDIGLGGNAISDAGAARLFEVIRHCSRLRRLDLSRNPLTDEAARIVATGLEQSSGGHVGGEHGECAGGSGGGSGDGGGNIRDDGSGGGGHAGQRGSGSLGGFGGSESGSITIGASGNGSGIGSGKNMSGGGGGGGGGGAGSLTLESLLLECRGLSAAGAAAIFSAMRSNRSLTELSVQWGLRSDRQWGRDLCEALVVNQSLRRLKVAPESWNVAQATHVARGLISNKSLCSFLPVFKIKSQQVLDTLSLAARLSGSLNLTDELPDLRAIDAPNLALSAAATAAKAQGEDLLLRAFASCRICPCSGSRPGDRGRGPTIASEDPSLSPSQLRDMSLGSQSAQDGPTVSPTDAEIGATDPALAVPASASSLSAPIATAGSSSMAEPSLKPASELAPPVAVKVAIFVSAPSPRPGGSRGSSSASPALGSGDGGPAMAISALGAGVAGEEATDDGGNDARPETNPRSRTRIRLLAWDLEGKPLLDLSVDGSSIVSLRRGRSQCAQAATNGDEDGGDDDVVDLDNHGNDNIESGHGATIVRLVTSSGQAVVLDFSIVRAARAMGIDTASGVFAEMDFEKLSEACESRARKCAFLLSTPAAARRLASLAAVQLGDHDAEALFVEYLGPIIRSRLGEGGGR